MKQIITIFFLLIWAEMSAQIGQQVNKKDGVVSLDSITSIDSIRFSADKTQMIIERKDGSTKAHAIADITDVRFAGKPVDKIAALDCPAPVQRGALIAGTPSGNGTAGFAANSGGQIIALTPQINPGMITSLHCGGTTRYGTLVHGVLASGVSSTVPYMGGNGGPHDGQVVHSTGVTGLTATLAPDTFAVGNGTLTYIITGTPASSGIASFALNIGGKSCNLIRVVNPGLITSLLCTGATHNGALLHGFPASGVSSTVTYSGGNGGSHNGQVVHSTGVTGLTATLAAGTFASGNGTLTYTITGTPAGSGTARFALYIGGKSCSITRVVNTGQVTSIHCTGATHNGTLVHGVPASGVSSVVSYSGGNGGPHNGQVVNSTGVTGLTATVTAGNFTTGDGTLTYIITGTPTSSGTARFTLNIGGKSCSLLRVVYSGRITALHCTGATHNGSLVQSVLASGVNSVVSYTGGNGGPHNGQVINSTGVTGLTATLTAGTFAIGDGTLTYTITGTPANSGTARFAINIGGKSCSLTRVVNPGGGGTYPPGTVHCTGTPTAIVDVLNPTTGKIWMDRNLGASQKATSSTDAASYGDLYQWGRRADGHQCRTSGTTTTLSSSDQPQHGNFILTPNSPWDWRSPQNTNLWQGVNGVNNPCPSGYRLPTETELNAERASWSSNNAAGAFASPLKLPVAGFRYGSDGSLGSVGSFGRYWSSTVSNTRSSFLNFRSSLANMTTYVRAYGFSVRCLKD